LLQSPVDGWIVTPPRYVAAAPEYGWWLSRRAEQLRLGEKEIKEGRIAAVFNR
jgi:hypothetical protein